MLNKELQLFLERKSAENVAARDNKSVIFRLPPALLADLQACLVVYEEENGVTLSLNKMAVSLLTSALKAEKTKRKRRRPAINDHARLVAKLLTSGSNTCTKSN